MPEYSTIEAPDKSSEVNDVIFSAINSKSAALISPLTTSDDSPILSPTAELKFPGVEVTVIADAQRLIDAINATNDNFIFIERIFTELHT